MIDLAKINNSDPLKRLVEKESLTDELSPMDPPEAYKPPVLDAVPYEELHPFLQHLTDEHEAMRKKLEEFEAQLIAFKEQGLRGGSEAFSSFFEYMDDAFVKHSEKEEKILFPDLQRHLIAQEEHSKAKFPKTVLDVLEDDHLKIMQHLTLLFNFLALASRLPDATSRALTCDVAAEQGFALIELLRLHFFREENIVFPKANKYIHPDEFQLMLGKEELFKYY